ncbi:ABC transporter ATP-binding protein [Lactobacillus sp. ESL0791]|uniref:ATP-binding cassette domain-containing protein n=1 Tax=Lactobacillus sp. ESL0791 TaxID=2983234 RepID=UPI0023F88DD3|nr:ABC transporter ATP-binding protein [Lactobacillus sp. ESL0791]MDF7639517.1 ABC transporter ATP-binding protein [Lactobacillus sp. ESL0791]
MNVKEIIKSNLPRALFIMIVYIIYSCAGTISEYMLKFATNSLKVANFRSFLFWMMIEAAAGILSVILFSLAAYSSNKQVQAYLHQVRDQLMHHYYGSGKSKLSEMENELGNNMKILADTYAQPWLAIFENVLVVAMSIGVLLSLHWSLILATAVITIIIFLLPKIMEKPLAKATANASEQNSRFLDTIEHWVSGLNELRRYQAFPRMNKELDRSSQKLAQANIKKQNLRGVAIGLNGLGNVLGQVGLSVFALILFFNHQIDLGSWMVAASFGSSIFNGLWQIIDAVTMINSTAELRKQTYQLRQNIRLSAAQPVNSVEVNDLVVQYQNGEKINYPDFTIKPGDKVLLTGDSGSGKSTLFKVLLGELEPKQGQVVYLTNQGQKVSPKEAQVGYIAQDSNLFPANIANNITMFADKLQAKVPAVAEQMQLTPDLAAFPAGIETQVDLDQDNLSGGQKQKVVLARAKIHETQMVLLDEATSAIDSKTTSKIIHELLQSQQTLLLIAHNFSSELVQQFDYQIHLQGRKGTENDD